jgi:hypothetical protein
MSFRIILAEFFYQPGCQDHISNEGGLNDENSLRNQSSAVKMKTQITQKQIDFRFAAVPNLSHPTGNGRPVSGEAASFQQSQTGVAVILFPFRLSDRI